MRWEKPLLPFRGQKKKIIIMIIIIIIAFLFNFNFKFNFDTKNGKTATWNSPKSGVKKLAYPQTSRGLDETRRKRGVRYWNVNIPHHSRGPFGPKTGENQKIVFSSSGWGLCLCDRERQKIENFGEGEMGRGWLRLARNFGETKTLARRMVWHSQISLKRAKKRKKHEKIAQILYSSRDALYY